MQMTPSKNDGILAQMVFQTDPQGYVNVVVNINGKAYPGPLSEFYCFLCLCQALC